MTKTHSNSPAPATAKKMVHTLSQKYISLTSVSMNGFSCSSFYVCRAAFDDCTTKKRIRQVTLEATCRIAIK